MQIQRAIRKAVASVVVPVMLVLAGCTDDGALIAIEKSTPDEYNIATQEPLTLPPDYELRPPRTSPDLSKSEEERQEVRQTVFGPDAESQRRLENRSQLSGQFSSGEMALLEQADALATEEDIRLKVDEETTAIVQANETLVDKLLFWKEAEPVGDVVDAPEENRRLQERSSQGQPVTGEDAPIIRREEEDKTLDVDKLWPF